MAKTAQPEALQAQIERPIGTTKQRAEYLDGQGGNDGLGVDQGRVAEVVQAVRAEDLSTGLEPHGLAEADARVLGEQLWGDASESAKHGPAGVDDLDLTVAAEKKRKEVSKERLSVYFGITTRQDRDPLSPACSLVGPA